LGFAVDHLVMQKEEENYELPNEDIILVTDEAWQRHHIKVQTLQAEGFLVNSCGRF